MNIKLNQKIIKEMCGLVSYKRGGAFYRANKVIFKEYGPDGCKATVYGMEDFYVTIEKDKYGGFLKECSCPTLTSYEKDCQHIAAVLLSVYEHQRNKTTPKAGANQLLFSANAKLTDDLLTIFNEQPVRSSVHQLHFEKRKALDVEFTCKPVTIGKGQVLFGISISISQIIVQNIREFLWHVKNGSPQVLSPTFTFNPIHYCFKKETDEVLRKLIQVAIDEQVYIAKSLTEKDALDDLQQLLIPPSSWDSLFPKLRKASAVQLEYEGNTFDWIDVIKEHPLLQFEFAESDDNSYELKINGINRMVVLELYRVVLIEGKVIQMSREDCKHLLDLKQMLEVSGMNQIPIPRKQINFFMEKVVPGLKSLGHVKIPESIYKEYQNIPLIAKLYLDRVKNRLLAGLEFQYENIVINPLESRELRADSIYIRDVEKEDAILKVMEESLFAKTEGGYFLHNEELEYEFLYNIVPQLQKLVQIYATTAVRNRVFRGNIQPRINVKVKKERTNWLEFKFEMDGIPEKDIRDILTALEEKRKYYRLRNGSLLSLETREFEEINRFLNELPAQNKDLESGLNIPIIRGIRLLDSVDGSNTITLEESLTQLLESLRNPDRLKFDIPSSLEPILRDYQKHGFKWMKTLAHYGFGGILADDMGLGKTVQSITFIVSELHNIRSKKQPALIVCPSSLTYNWLSEMTKFAPSIQAVVIDGNKTERSIIRKDLTDFDVVIISYPLLRSDIKLYENQTFHTVFFDEAQFFKNPLTQTARAMKKIQANYRFALTGTPVENSLEELWSIFHIVYPELFLGLKEFSNLSRKTIARRIRPFLLRRMKEDVLLELPGKVESMDMVELFTEQKKVYAAYLAKLRHDTLKHLDKDTLRKNRIKILAGLTRLRQICCHPLLFVDGYKGSSAKFEQLKQIIEDSKLSGRRVLIFSQFTKMLKIIGKDLAVRGMPFFYLDGQTSSEERLETCNRFNRGERDLFLISLKAGGTGLNLTGADTVILYDTWWNPAVEVQAADRAHRIGQTKSVQVIKLIARGTIEEKINELQEKKKLLMEEIVDPKKESNSTLTEEDIREIFMI